METAMDTSKWKSILVPKDIYEEIKTLSQKEGRTISGQLRLIHETFKKVNPPVRDVYVQE
tara:strand:+ start:413 stop:592 length:180 start_codon:yes stop_codon:yes gene_type:complete